MPVVAPGATLTFPLLVRAMPGVPTVNATAVLAEIVALFASLPVTVTAYVPEVVLLDVDTVRAAVAAAVPVIVTGPVTEHVGIPVVFVIVVLTMQERSTVPT